MTNGSEIGFVASALVLVAFGMKDMINLRIVAICSNFVFIAYALVLDLPPVLVLHIILLPLNGWRLAQAFQERHRAHKISERSWESIFGKTAVAALAQGLRYLPSLSRT